MATGSSVYLEAGYQAAASLFESGETITFSDYVRGMVETLARMFPIEGMDTGERAEHIFLGIQKRVYEGRVYDR